MVRATSALLYLFFFLRINKNSNLVPDTTKKTKITNSALVKLTMLRLKNKRSKNEDKTKASITVRVTHLHTHTHTCLGYKNVVHLGHLHHNS